MYVQMANTVLSGIYAYLAIGLFVAAIVVVFGLERIDSEGAGAGVGFRLIILPGAAALWPLLLRRMIRGGGRPSIQKDPHR